MSVLDIISNGRVSYAFGIGHRAEQYEHVGVDMRRRGRLADEKPALLLELLKGKPVVYEGRRIHVTPQCTTKGGPHIMLAGGCPAAVRRAAKHGLGFLSQANAAELKELYESQCRAHGHAPGFLQFPDGTAPTTVLVAGDVDSAWNEVGPYLLHDAMTAAAYRHGDETVASISRAKSVNELRTAQGPYRIFTTDEATPTCATVAACHCCRYAAGCRRSWPGHTSSAQCQQWREPAETPESKRQHCRRRRHG